MTHKLMTETATFRQVAPVAYQAAPERPNIRANVAATVKGENWTGTLIVAAVAFVAVFGVVAFAL